jgi:glycosyltransferase involved in cell wall biosynthesis
VTVRNSIIFIATNPSWGGSEELWADTAYHLVREGVPVSVGAHTLHEPIERLAKAGVHVQYILWQRPLWKRVWDKAFPSGKSLWITEVERLLAGQTPALVVISDAGTFRSIDLLEFCASQKWPFAVVTQANSEDFWPDDDLAARHRNVLPAVRRWYFVSKGNLKLFERQVGCEVPNAEVIRNPFNVAFDAAPPWRPLGDNGELHLACVARLHPPSKGQHILLEALSDPAWRARNWRLSLYGNGPMRNSIERMVQHLGLRDHVSFLGYETSVDKIWANNHVLILPSRYEGLPLAMVEAMLCSRPVVATDVAGHSEIIEDGITGFLADAPTSISVRGALERVWSQRSELEAMGRAAGKSIRARVPMDPVRVFAEKIKLLADTR